MDVKPVNFNLPVNVTQVIDVVAEIAEKTTGVANVLDIVTNVKEDIRLLTNLTRLIEQTPIANFTENLVAWDAIERLLQAFGLDTVIDIRVIETFLQSIEDTLLDPDQLLIDFLGFSLTEAVENVLD